MAEHIPPGPWDDFPEAWDIVAIGDRDWPGLARVDISRANKWDTKKAAKTHGGEREFKGADLASVKIEIRFWTSEDWDLIVNELLSMVEPDPGKKKPEALKLSHVSASARKVSAITVDSVTGPIVSGGQGVITIDATEYREPDKKNAGGKASGKGSLCQQLANQLALLQAQRTVDVSLYNYYSSIAGLDIQKAGETYARVVATDAEIAAVQAHQLANKCNEAAPSSTDGAAQEKAQGLVNQ